MDIDATRGSLARTAPDASRLNGDAAPTSPSVTAGLLGGLDQRKNRGRAVTIAPFGGMQRVVDVSGDDQLATVTTISIATVLQPAEGSTEVPTDERRIPAVAHIEWGTDGGFAGALIDVGRGTIVQVPSSSVRVSVGVDPEYAPFLESLDLFPSLGVIGSIGYLPSARGPSQRTHFGLIGEELEMVRVVPAFARRARIVRSIPAAVLTIELMSNTSVLATFDTIDPELEIAVPNWMTGIRVTSPTDGNVSIVWELWI